MPSVAIVGTAGSGKTVLLTTLAKRFGVPGNIIHLEPENSFTNKFVNRTWKTLTQKEWPPSTPPGDLHQLHWKITAGSDARGDLQITDCAGQDLWYLFVDGAIDKPNELPDKLKALVKSIDMADIVLFVTNLADLVGVKDPDHIDDNQWFVNAAMKYVERCDGTKPFSLVFTKTELFSEYRKTHGSWLGVAQHYLPNVHQLSFGTERVAVLGVSAVRDTEIEVHPEFGPRRVPIPGFSSEGLEELAVWIAEQFEYVSEIQAERDRMATEEKRQKALERQAEKERQEREKSEAILKAAAIRALPFAGLSFVLIGLVLGLFLLPLFPITKSVDVTDTRPIIKKVPIYGTELQGTWPFRKEVKVIIGYEDVVAGYENYVVGTKSIRTAMSATGWIVLLLTTAVGTSAVFAIAVVKFRDELQRSSR